MFKQKQRKEEKAAQARAQQDAERECKETEVAAAAAKDEQERKLQAGFRTLEEAKRCDPTTTAPEPTDEQSQTYTPPITPGCAKVC